MTPDEVAQLGLDIDAALDALRRCVFRMGMAGQWHIGKATGISADHARFQRHVVAMEEKEKTRYLARLDELIAATRRQDEKCASLWEETYFGSRERYETEHTALCTLLEQFAFRPKAYETVVRQADKPLLLQARQLAHKPITDPAVQELERTLRLRLSEFIELEEQISRILTQLDASRDALAEAHRVFAIDCALATGSADEHTIQAALYGLRKAADYYDYKQGYDFPDYAQHWIKRAIETRNST